jgi:GrpB-like predicted nucleotidyltransferase (UPF0157 family)
MQLHAYQSHWPLLFHYLQARLWSVVAPHAECIEHVGSTAVPGLTAKPIIDIDIVVATPADVVATRTALTQIGYQWRGDQGIPGREAFAQPRGWFRHHLYVCQTGTLALRNHLCLRDALRNDPVLCQRYADLKVALSRTPGITMTDYVAGKSDFIVTILHRHGFTAAELTSIQHANRAPQKAD